MSIWYFLVPVFVLGVIAAIIEYKLPDCKK